MATFPATASAGSGPPVGRRRAEPFVRPLPLAGWPSSSWGYDPAMECFWAELRPVAGAPVRIGPQHLITTVTGLARAVARTARVRHAAAYLALTA